MKDFRIKAKQIIVDIFHNVDAKDKDIYLKVAIVNYYIENQKETLNNIKKIVKKDRVK